MRVHAVDGTYELFRAHYGSPSASAPDGTEVGAVRGAPEGPAAAPDGSIYFSGAFGGRRAEAEFFDGIEELEAKIRRYLSDEEARRRVAAWRKFGQISSSMSSTHIGRIRSSARPGNGPKSIGK